MSQRENVNPIREQNHRKNSRRYQKRAAARRRRNTIFIMEIVLLLILAVVLFFVSKLSKIEKTKLDMDKIEVNEDISQESQKIMKGYQTIAMFKHCWRKREYPHCDVWSGQSLQWKFVAGAERCHYACQY